MSDELNITVERVDDVVLLLEVMKQMDLPGILDREIARHGLEQGLSTGWSATIWLAHILSQGDHRKLTVRDWVKQAHTTLERVTGLSIRDTDFTDDRLSLVLRRLSDEATWQALETELSAHLVRVYDLKAQVVRVDATTVSGYHAASDAGLMQFGHSKDDDTLRQVKVMMGSLDPLGLPLITDVVAGQHADDPLYVAVIDRVIASLNRQELLFVGDSKMSALGTRAHLQGAGQWYLTPLAWVGETAQQRPEWIATGLARADLTAVRALEDETIIAEGYEFTQECHAEVDGQSLTWEERVLVVRSLHQADAQQRGLHERLARAESELSALTPPRGRGQRQITNEAALHTAAEAILAAHRVAGLLTYAYERQVEQETRFAGRGRGGPDRPTRTVERVRYQLSTVTRDEEAIAALEQTFGWRAYVTNAPPEHLALSDAVRTYRQEYLIEHGFGRLKGAPLSIAPLYVQRDDQIAGLTHLLTLALRVLSVIEFVVRRQLQATGEPLVGLHPENPQKGTTKPTAERLLRAFNNLSLTIVHLPDRLIRHLTPLSPVQTRILELLGLSPDAYHALVAEIPNSPIFLRE
jgi:transposase